VPALLSLRRIRVMIVIMCLMFGPFILALAIWRVIQKHRSA
jgi:hypothetical protein